MISNIFAILEYFHSGRKTFIQWASKSNACEFHIAFIIIFI
jgi:hypothetical protein